MKTTLDLDDRLLREAQRRAADEGRTLDSLVEEALREAFDEQAPDEPYVFSFPTADLGEPMVDIADRKAVYEFLDDGA